MTDAVKMAIEALRPFAETFAETFVDEDGWKGPMTKERIVDWFGPSDFRGAVQTLAALEQAGEPEAVKQSLTTDQAGALSRQSLHLKRAAAWAIGSRAAGAPTSAASISRPRAQRRHHTRTFRPA